MKHTAGARIRDVREMMGLTRQQFAELLKLDPTHIRNVELERSKLNQDDFAAIGQTLPELLPWLTYEADVSLEDLMQSQNKWLRLIAVRVETMDALESNGLAQSIKAKS